MATPQLGSSKLVSCFPLHYSVGAARETQPKDMSPTPRSEVVVISTVMLCVVVAIVLVTMVVILIVRHKTKTTTTWFRKVNTSAAVIVDVSLVRLVVNMCMYTYRQLHIY